MYTTVYELDSSTLWRAYVLAPGISRDLLILFAIGVGSAIYGILRRQPNFLLGIVPFLVISSFWVPVLRGELRWGQSLLDTYRRGGCQIAEGRTHVQAQQRAEGHSIDRIVIGGVPLEVSHFELGPQYTDSIVYGGVLKEGVDARVWYCPKVTWNAGTSGPIVRVDVRRPANGSSPAR